MIGGLRRFSFTGVLVALTIVVLAGCKATGGGYITSATGEGKATFAFHGECTNTTDEFGNAIAEVKGGQLQYNDHPADVKFHADFDLENIVIFGTCEEIDTDASGDEFVGEYRVSGGPKEAEGFVYLNVRDNGEPGINGDLVEIFLLGGRYSDYFNSGTVQGGNVQVH
jgi:hypothetical protein